MRKAKANSETKDRLIKTAQQLIYVKGFVPTTVDEICQTAGLSKGSFFHYFKSKEDLGKAVLDYFSSSIYDILENEDFFVESDPLQRIYELIDLFIILSANVEGKKTWLIGNFAQTLSITHPEIREMCADYFSRIAGLLKRELDAARAKYAPESTIDTQSLADYFLAIFEGSLILAKAKLDAKIIEKNLLLYRQHIAALFEK